MHGNFDAVVDVVPFTQTKRLHSLLLDVCDLPSWLHGQNCKMIGLEVAITHMVEQLLLFRLAVQHDQPCIKLGAFWCLLLEDLAKHAGKLLPKQKSCPAFLLTHTHAQV